MPSERPTPSEWLEAEVLKLRATEASRDAEFRALFDLMPQLGWTAAADGAIDFYNRGWRDYTGRTFEDMQGWGWTAVHDPEVLPAVLARWKESLRTGTALEMEFPLRRHDGQFRWFLTRVTPVRGADGAVRRWVGVNADIHAQRQAGNASEERFRLLVDSIQDYAILMLDVEGRVETWNRGAQRVLGFSAEEMIGQLFSRFYAPADMALGKPAQALEVAATEGRFEEEGWRLRKDGSSFWASTIISALHGEDGTLRGFAKITRDYTARKALADAAESTRQVLEERDQLFALTTDLIGIAGFDGHFRRISPSWEKTLGWTTHEITSRPWLDFVHPEDVAKTVAIGARLSAGSEISFFENRCRCKSGAYRWLDWRCVPLVSKGLIYSIARDITAAKEAEESRAQLQRQLVVADRMVSVGTLAAGVAHEINNPLSYVTTNLDLVLEEVRALAGGSPSARLKDLEDMVLDAREGAERVRKIVRGLKTFSRTDDERRSVMEVKPSLELAINMAFNEIRHRARLVKDYGETPLIEADDTRLGQVFINLLVNAAQAIPEGNAEGNEIRIVTSTDAGGRAVVEVRDTGVGIPVGVRDRIFEPFFTTKSVGVGTGLGLSICHNILSGMGGEISVSSEVGHGATFRVVLPPAAVQRLSQPPTSATDSARVRRGTVLVVDDEPAVGMALKRILREHDVTVLTSVKEALEVLLSGKRFDVIFSDLMMPQMTGMDFYRELTRRSPDDAARMVFVTGGAFTPIATEFLEQIGNERVEKPFTPKAVRELAERFMK